MNRAVVAYALLVLWLSAVAPASLADEAHTFTLSSSAWSLGSFPADGVSSGNAIATVGVAGPDAWQLSVRLVDRNPRFVLQGKRTETLFIRGGDAREWRELRPDTAVMLVSRPAGAATPEQILVETRATATLDASPGQRKRNLELLLNDRIVAQVEVDYAVAPTLNVIELSERTVANVDVTIASIQPVLAKLFHVKANVDWILEIRLREPSGSSNRQFANDQLFLYPVSSGKPEPLTRSHFVRAATGHPKGEEGVSVEVAIGVSSERLLLSGRYDCELETRLRQATANGESN
jgi:hypothetical protein